MVGNGLSMQTVASFVFFVLGNLARRDAVTQQMLQDSLAVGGALAAGQQEELGELDNGDEGGDVVLIV